MKKILIVAYRFAPSSSSGTFRSLGFVKHLSERGWDLQVLTIKERYAEQTDRNLLLKIPTAVKLVRTSVFDPFRAWAKLHKCIPEQSAKNMSDTSAGSSNSISENSFSFKEIVSQFLKTPDNQIGWLFPAVLKFFCLSKPSLIYSSAPPFTSHLVAVAYKKIWRAPLICDFRDPWLDNPFHQRRSGWLSCWEEKLEKLVYRNSDIVIANTDPMANLFINRYPEMRSRIHVITNGFDPEDFENISVNRDVPLDSCLMLHPGTLYGARDPRSFLEAVRIAVKEHGCSRLVVQLIGPCEDFGGESLLSHVQRLGLAGNVQISPSIPHKQSLERMKGADLLLLFSQGTNIQIPAKLYEYMALHKTIFAVTEPDSATDQIVQGLGSHHFSAINQPEKITDKLVIAYNQWLLRRTGDDEVHFDNTHKFLRSSLTDQLETLMRSCLEKRKE